MSMSVKLRCYCCGEPLPTSFSLVSMSIAPDRVFVMLDEHVIKVDDAKTVVRVHRAPPVDTNVAQSNQIGEPGSIALSSTTGNKT